MVHDGHPLAKRLRLVHVVRGEHHRMAFRADVPKQVPQVPPGLRVQRPRRLVEEQHVRAVHEGAGDGQPLGLPAGELLGPGCCQVGQAHHLQHGIGPPGGDSVEGSERAQLFTGSEMLKEGRCLKLNAHPGQQRRVARPRRHAQHAHLAAVRPAQALDNLQRGGLAGPVGPEDAEELTLLDLECHPVNRAQISVGLA